MDIQRFNPGSLAKPIAAYCQVTRRGPIVTTAGMIATDAGGKVVGLGDIAAQTRQALENVKAALEAAGASLKDVVKTTIFITDLANYQGMNAVYNEYFAQNPPARSTVRVDLVLPTLLIEIEAIAILDSAGDSR
jgi:2-iminobutanoate/2-iminopropanoate deaminase